MDALKILLVLLPLFCYAQREDEEGALAWEPGIELQWEDFRAEPPIDNGVAAYTATGLSYTFNTPGASGNYRLDAEVIAYFYPEKSWYLPKLSSSEVLEHQRLHFDIAEIYARKMRKILSERTFSENVHSEIHQIFSELNRELYDYQNSYDFDTYFSRNRKEQLRWNKRIAQQLVESTN